MMARICERERERERDEIFAEIFDEAGVGGADIEMKKNGA